MNSLAGLRLARDWVERGGPWELRTVLLGSGLYLAAFTVMRLALSTGLMWDDAEQAVFSQRLAWGYAPDQPPLYTWLLWGVQRVLGVTPAAHLILNYALCLFSVGLFYRSARRILGDARDATLATLALFSIYQIGWRIHESFTHNLLLMACCAASFWSFLRVLDRGNRRDYLILGVWIGLGLLSKYNFVVFLGALVLAAALQPALRRVLLRPEMLVSLGVGAVLVLPHLLWLLARWQELPAVYRELMIPDPHAGWFGRALAGLGSLPVALVAFLSPLLPISALVVPRILVPWLAPDPPPANPAAPDLVRLNRDLPLMGVLLLILLALASGVGKYEARWMNVLLLFAPLYLVARIRRARPSALQRRVLVAALLAFPLGVFAVRSAQLVLGPPICARPCRGLVPFDQLAAKLAEAGFTDGTIVTEDSRIGGNLRMWFTDSRFVWTQHLSFDPPHRAARGQCLIVWNLDSDGPDPPSAALEYADLPGNPASFQASARRATIRWRLPFRGERSLVTTWAYIFLPQGAGRCA